jgi:hypothetical protein
MQPIRIKQAKSAIVVFILYRWEQRLRELLRRIAGLDMTPRLPQSDFKCAVFFSFMSMKKKPSNGGEIFKARAGLPSI